MSRCRLLPSAAVVQRAGELVVLAVAPLVLNGGVLVLEAQSRGGVAYDFREALLPAARAVLDGRSPFSPATAAALRPGTAFVYPPVAAFLFAPLAWLPTEVASYALSLIVLACVPATLWVLGVRDWRCYGASLLWSPVVYSVRLGALSPLLCLLVALIWRHRAHVALPAVALAGAIALKLFLWPLVAWLAATRRWKSTAVAIGVATALVLVPWAGLSFAGLLEYPRLLHVLSSIEAPESYTIAAVVRKLGSSWRLAEYVSSLVGLAILGAAVRAGRRSQDTIAFVLALGSALLLSPIVWVHYFVLLLVPVAIACPSFGLAWLLPVALWPFPITAGEASWRAIATALLLSGATVLISGRSRVAERFRRPAVAF